MGQTPCPLHDAVMDALADHETRLRDKTARVTRVEIEVEGMQEKLDTIAENQEKTTEAIRAGDAFQTKILTIFGTVMFLIQVVPLIAAWLK